MGMSDNDDHGAEVCLCSKLIGYAQIAKVKIVQQKQARYSIGLKYRMCEEVNHCSALIAVRIGGLLGISIINGQSPSPSHGGEKII